jgi:hypothetical protein
MSKLTVFPMPTPNCTVPSIDCNDPNSVLIHTILSLANPTGSTLDEIIQRIPVVCPTITWSQKQLETNITVALRRGIVITYYPDTYAVNAGMVRANPANRSYFCICQLFKS